MIFGTVKKQETIKLPEQLNQLNLHQGLEAISWVDTLVSGRYIQHSGVFVYVDMSESIYTTSFLAQVYSSATFYCSSVGESAHLKNLFSLRELPDQSVNYMYLGHTLSFVNEHERKRLFEFIQTKLAPGGYVITSYEAKAGWSEYRVILVS